MYLPFLVLHSVLRWLVLLAGVLAVSRALAGLLGRRPWTPTDDRSGRLFVISIDVQTLIGLVLYGVLSPITQGAFEDMAVAMRDATLRFWAVEHIVMMLAALVLAHVGRARSSGGAAPDLVRHRRAAIFFTIALVVIFVAMPWPWAREARPLFPFR
jgi:hypothetical protein